MVTVIQDENFKEVKQEKQAYTGKHIRTVLEYVACVHYCVFLWDG